MTRLRPLPARAVVRILERAGFQQVGQRGSHLKLRHPDGRIVIVPVHPGRDLKVGLLARIVAASGLDRRLFE